MNLGMTRVLDPVTRDAIVSLLRSNQKIKAIKMYRLSTNAGLLEAKQAVEAIAAQNNIPAMTGGAAVNFPFSTLLLLGLVVLIGAAIYFARFAPAH